jgi:pSer/pThr/pTyr-binding forkhead associated (FHA) protein
MAYRSLKLLIFSLFTTVLVSLGLSGVALGAPEAHILRIDPSAALENGSPILTSVIEVVENRRVSEVTLPCASLTGNARLSCMSEALEKTPLYTAFPFPAQNAVFTVRVDDGDVLAKHVSDSRWGESQQQPGVGTAWLIIIDADSRMGNTFDEAKEVANKFVASMGPNDIVNVIFINDRQVTGDSRWLPATQRAKATSFIGSVGSTYASQGRNRSLLSIIRSAATDAWKSLGNTSQQDVKVPLHQAMVVLSSGFGGADALTNGAGALQLQQYMNGGRFPEDNTAMPKAPVPVISIYFPPSVIDEYKTSALEFMQNIANPEIGGFFTILENGQSARAPGIVNSVRTRFSKMYVVKWRVSCVARSVTQTFQLNFANVKPAIAGDNSFKDVPIGIDPTTWPLDIDLQTTQDSVKKQGGVYPGGKFKVFGNFCWGGEAQRAEVYFIPAGQQLPTALAGTDVEQARKTQQQLIEMGMRGKSLEATDSFVEFEAPDKDKLLHGSGEQAVVRLVVYDNAAKRTSGVTANSVVQLKGTTQPFPLIPVLGGALGLVVVALLLVVLLRSNGKKPARPATPAPVVAQQPVPVMPQAAPVMPQAAPSPEFLYGAGAAPLPNAGLGSPVGNAQRAVLQSASGVYTVVPGLEMHVGRDGNRCEVLLAEARVSGLHSSLKLEGGQLFVRDENSNNGTFVNSTRLQPGVWSVVPNGSLLRFGPIEMTVRLE